MLLGSIFQQLRDQTVAADALLSLGDIVLLAEVDAARIVHDESVGEYVSGAAQRFARHASDEDWLRLMTALETSEQPAATCLTSMVRWSIAEEAKVGTGAPMNGCSCGGGAGGTHDHA